MLALARLLLATARHSADRSPFDRGAELLDRLIAQAEATGRQGSLIRALILRALAFQHVNETDAAVTTLARALALAAPDGLIRTFVDEGPSLQTVFEKVLEAHRKKRLPAEWQISPDYAGRLLAAFGGAVPLPAKAFPLPYGES
ncbi:MAG: hypothetical protein IPK19_05815 [Chloroflexi bacterium]|nr:hypothetical protein [Chloroflexota bacterium]